MVAAAEHYLLVVDLKDQASLFFKLLLKNQGGVLYPFSEKTLLIRMKAVDATFNLS